MIGKEAFRLLVNDKRFSKVPMYLETPKGSGQDEKEGKFDTMNLKTLRRMVGAPPKTVKSSRQA
jgi:deoxyribonuclease-4